MLDGVVGGSTGVVMMRDGTLRGGDSFYYYVGSYSCSSGRWKGEVTNQEHTQMFEVRPFARKIVSMGFAGTYTDEDAEFEATALAGKQSIRMKVVLRLPAPARSGQHGVWNG
jgi:hypothetical protein